MRVNTAKSMRLARQVKGRFGTWAAVRQASRVENGVYVVDPSAGGDRDSKDVAVPATA
ncbi:MULTISPECIES: hypothetical protein [unclassified Sphingomonas]|uniref:Putative NAD/FAD-binding protein n=1 Tax=Sphingomonas leidyi TaxID=68569 RepID=A0A7X5ZXW5_9SPHN|nr:MULTISPECIES: hypothetical protein [unclassified Sphingomonas]NIJ67244.1 putative NAD/FAD-binding protein [Sphingomonas leidyi]